MTRSAKKRVYQLFRFTLLSAWLFITGFPLFWMVATSFKPAADWFAWPPVYWSSEPTLTNYKNVWITDYVPPDNSGGIGKSMQEPFDAMKNSLTISLIATTITVAFGTCLAYGVSRFRILSEKRMFHLLMFRMVPPIVIAAPVSIYYSHLGLVDTLTGLVIMYIISTLPYAVWMAKSFIDEIPIELEHAAAILGAGKFRTLWEIIFPLVRSGVMATFMFILILTWSEYLLALILSKTEVVTLPIQLSKFEGSSEGRFYGRQAALSVGITLPLLFIGLIIRKHLVRGLSFGMVKR